MYWGGAQQQDDATASERELSALVRDKVRAARRAQQFEEAERILNPPGDGGDGVAAEAWRNAHEATRTALETQRQEAQEARSSAATAHQRVDQARTEGLQAGLRVADREVAAVRAEADAKVDAMARVAEMATNTVKEVAQARGEADRASADARVRAVEDVAGFWKGMAEGLMSRVFGPAPSGSGAAPAAQPSFADQMRGLGEALKVVREVAGPTQESAMDYRVRRLTDVQAEASKEQSGAITRFLENHVGPFLQDRLPTIVESFKPGTSGTFPAAPPPK
jgi:membrane protein involved in colicin uptake